ncbi:MAG: hypothetical protein R3F54_20380 [Alphaproteobacteria bacterium]
MLDHRRGRIDLRLRMRALDGETENEGTGDSGQVTPWAETGNQHDEISNLSDPANRGFVRRTQFGMK